jgi:alginate O-acetyltransferase complex protein AlgI
MKELVSLALWLAGVGHFCVLGASFQVPARLEWATDLPKLKPFNRKLMWTYAAFTLMTIVAFGALTLGLHEELLRGDRAALWLAAFIAVFWSARVGVDFLYFERSDWPKGKGLALGHLLLTSLFIAMASAYWLALFWHWIRP